MCVVNYLLTATCCHTAYDYIVHSVSIKYKYISICIYTYVYRMYMNLFLFLTFLLYCLLQYYCSLVAVMNKFPHLLEQIKEF